MFHRTGWWKTCRKHVYLMVRTRFLVKISPLNQSNECWLKQAWLTSENIHGYSLGSSDLVVEMGWFGCTPMTLFWNNHGLKIGDFLWLRKPQTHISIVIYWGKKSTYPCLYPQLHTQVCVIWFIPNSWWTSWTTRFWTMFKLVLFGLDGISIHIHVCWRWWMWKSGIQIIGQTILTASFPRPGWIPDVANTNLGYD